MTIEEAYVFLENYAEELSGLGNAKEALKTNKEEFIKRYSKVKETLNYIKQNSQDNEEVIDAAIGVLVCTTFDNPTLGKLLETMPESNNIQYIEKLVAQKSSLEELFEIEEMPEGQFIYNSEMVNVKTK